MENYRLIEKNVLTGENHVWEIEEKKGEKIAHFIAYGNPSFCGRLLKENNRGWTIRSYMLGSNYVDVFLSRGEYKQEAFEPEK